MILNPKDVIRKLYLREKLDEKSFNNFLNKLESFKEEIKENDEEYNKGLIRSFFYDGVNYSKNFKINTKEKIDLAIYKNKIPEVLIEIKSPNSMEMVRVDNLNKKAFHEIVLYYLREKIKYKNYNIRHIIITNGGEWFIFDSSEFEKIVIEKKIEKVYIDFEIDKKSAIKTTEGFYNFLKDFFDTNPIKIDFVNIDFDKSYSSKQLQNIYKLLSPRHLLKEYIQNDSNTLNRKFYDELLHILGLMEIQSGSKKLITRKKVKDRECGTFVENTILKLQTEFKIEDEERLFEIAIELNITWLNRILFLKLFEARLSNIHNEKYHKFLSYEITDSFDKLNTLFFEILAYDICDRKCVKIEKYKDIPYLNSALFDTTKLEERYLRISNLSDYRKIEKYKSSILKDDNRELNNLEYMLKFLNAYDFGSDNKILEFQKPHDTMINSAVLGLIFEKLNGYKDGSFFTPSFITMYMTKEIIRQKVVEKFNQKYLWSCKNLDEICNKDLNIKEANEVINSITICDPAVGSGHFLVSSLNEILFIKSKLKILADENGLRLKYISIEIENDELIIFDEDGENFEYKLNKNGKVSDEIIRIQKTIFNEKLKIIENQLFGIDINQSSVEITRLRLWIELLKESYYENSELVTLPNIDINIKCGNSLISRYNFKDNIVIPEFKEEIESYRKVVKEYKKSNKKENKYKITDKIISLKKDIRVLLKYGLSESIKLRKLLRAYVDEYGVKGLNKDLVYEAIQLTTNLSGNNILEMMTKKQKEEIERERKNELKPISKLEEEIEHIENGEIYKNAFEWRFEFPEVLNEDGDFIGFDVIVANPPYGASLKNEIKEIYKIKYQNVHTRTIDTFNYFISMSSNLLKNNAILSFIVPNNLLYQNEYEKTRKFIIDNYFLLKVINLGDNIFKDANVPTSIIEYQNRKIESNYDFKYKDIRDSKEKIKEFKSFDFKIHNKNSLLKTTSYTFGIEPKIVNLIDKIKEKSYLIDDIALEVASGISTGGDKIFRISQDFIDKNNLENEILEKVLVGREINRYELNDNNHKLLYIARDTNIKSYPNTLNYLKSFKEKLMQRSESKKGILPWFSLGRPRDKKLFTEDKIIIRQTSDSIIAYYDTSGYFVLNSLLIFKINPKFNINYKFATAILNSKLTTLIYKNFTGEEGRTFAEVKPKNIRKLYIPKVDKNIQDEFVKIVDKIIEFKKETKDTTELENLIDEKIYKIYKITNDEIKKIKGTK